MEKIIFILDRAHGVDVVGKASPDGTYKEWEGSKHTIQSLKENLVRLKIPYVENVTEDIEVGLSERVKRANKHSKDVEHAILLSFHNNGGGGSGNELFIKKTPSKKDIEIANIFADNLIKDFPDVKWRKTTAKKKYKEENFTVIAGNNSVKPLYNGVLIEFLFMDNENDLILLKDDEIQKKYTESILYSIVEVCKKYGYGDFKDEIIIK